jgi:hypothetical protein
MLSQQKAGKVDSELIVSLDPGSSLTKVFYFDTDGKEHYLTMQPHIARITSDIATKYQGSLIENSLNLGQIWVRDMDMTYALGNLASDRFLANLRLKERKYEYAIYKVLGVVGYLSEMMELEPGCKLTLGLLLPFTEYEDRKLIEESLRRILESFEFCGRRHSISLKEFKCRPEGFGMFVKGLDGKVSAREQRIGSLILGHRNASWLQVDRGIVNLEISETNDYGFSWLVGEVQKMTSIKNELRLTEAISRAGAQVQEQELEPLIEARDLTLAEAERNRLKTAVITAREQYWLQLVLWLERKLQGVDHVVVSGGVAPYLQEELKGLLKGRVSWGQQLARDLAQRYNLKEKADLSRLMDSFGLFLSLRPELRSGVIVHGK